MDAQVFMRNHVDTVSFFFSLVTYAMENNPTSVYRYAACRRCREIGVGCIACRVRTCHSIHVCMYVYVYVFVFACVRVCVCVSTRLCEQKGWTCAYVHRHKDNTMHNSVNTETTDSFDVKLPDGRFIRQEAFIGISLGWCALYKFSECH